MAKLAPRATLLNIDACLVGNEGGCKSESGDARTESQSGRLVRIKLRLKFPGAGATQKPDS